MNEQIPSVGRIVHYKLSAQDALHILCTRHNPAVGNSVKEGDIYPMMIVRVWGPSYESAVNGQVFLDGNDVLWAMSCSVGDRPGTFSWPAHS